MGLAVVVAVERDGRDGRVRGWVWVIVGVAAAVAVVGVSVPWLRSFFELAEPDAADWLVIAGVGGCGWFSWRSSVVPSPCSGKPQAKVAAQRR